MPKKVFSKRFPNSKYAWTMFSDNLQDAVTYTVNALTRLLGEVVIESSDEAEVQATTDLVQAIERYRDGYWYTDSGLSDNEESAELVE